MILAPTCTNPFVSFMNLCLCQSIYIQHQQGRANLVAEGGGEDRKAGSSDK